MFGELIGLWMAAVWKQMGSPENVHLITPDVMLHACGPEGMLAATARTAMIHGRACEVSVERIMGCGLGGCYSCVVPMRGTDGEFHHVRSCLAGPVLLADQVRWD